MSERNALWLAFHDWNMDAPWDLCWLDCPEPGYLLVSGNRCICLCLAHAVTLQAGCWHGDYSGAPLPPASRAVAWPWQLLDGSQLAESAA